MFTRKDLLRLIGPLIVEQILAATIGIADTVMVSGVGEAAVSGVSLVDTLNLLLINVFAALATGGAIVVAQFLGREEDENANIAAKQLLLVTTILSAIIMAVCLLFKRPLLNCLFGDAEQAVMKEALTYFAISALSYPFISIYNAAAALFRSQGNSRISMVASFVMNMVNIGGNALLIFVFHLGVAGAGIASLASRFLGALFLIWLLCSQNNRVKLSEWTHWEFHPKMVQNILRIGVPNGLENGMFQIGKILVQGLIASLGTAAIAANAMANSIMTIANIPGNAISLAIITVVGQCIGARKLDEGKHYTLKLTGWAYLLIGIMTLGIFLSLDFLIGAFGLSDQAAEQARWCCIVACIGNLVWPVSFTLPNGLRAANDVRFTMLTSVFSMWVFRVAFSYVLARTFQWGVVGVWTAMVIDWVFRAVLFVTRLLSNRWKKHCS